MFELVNITKSPVLSRPLLLQKIVSERNSEISDVLFLSGHLFIVLNNGQELQTFDAKPDAFLKRDNVELDGFLDLNLTEKSDATVGERVSSSKLFVIIQEEDTVEKFSVELIFDNGDMEQWIFLKELFKWSKELSGNLLPKDDPSYGQMVVSTAHSAQEGVFYWCQKSHSIENTNSDNVESAAFNVYCNCINRQDTDHIVENCPPCDLYIVQDGLLIFPSKHFRKCSSEAFFLIWKPLMRTVLIVDYERDLVHTERWEKNEPLNFTELVFNLNFSHAWRHRVKSSPETKIYCPLRKCLYLLAETGEGLVCGLEGGGTPEGVKARLTKGHQPSVSKIGKSGTIAKFCVDPWSSVDSQWFTVGTGGYLAFLSNGTVRCNELPGSKKLCEIREQLFARIFATAACEIETLEPVVIGLTATDLFQIKFEPAIVKLSNSQDPKLSVAIQEAFDYFKTSIVPMESMDLSGMEDSRVIQLIKSPAMLLGIIQHTRDNGKKLELEHILLQYLQHYWTNKSLNPSLMTDETASSTRVALLVKSFFDLETMRRDNVSKNFALSKTKPTAVAFDLEKEIRDLLESKDEPNQTHLAGIDDPSQAGALRKSDRLQLYAKTFPSETMSCIVNVLDLYCQEPSQALVIRWKWLLSMQSHEHDRQQSSSLSSAFMSSSSTSSRLIDSAYDYLYEVICRLLYQLRPTELPNFVKKCSQLYEKYLGAEEKRSGEFCDNDLYNRALNCLPSVETQNPAMDRVKTRAKLLLLSKKENGILEGLQLLLKYKLWEQGIALVQKEQKTQTEKYPQYFQCLIMGLNRGQVLPTYFRSVVNLVPVSYNLLDVIKLLKESTRSSQSGDTPLTATVRDSGSDIAIRDIREILIEKISKIS